jgi:two-component system, chemotaxis family, response regulator Rcp1
MSSHFRRPVDVLYINDKSDQIDLFEKAIASWKTPHTLKIVRDRDEACRRLAACPKDDSSPDLVILDYQLQQYCGIDVVRNVRGNEMVACIPIIVMSKDVSAENIKQAYDHYANCFIETPSDFEGMRNIIGAIERFWLQTAFIPGLRKSQKFEV